MEIRDIYDNYPEFYEAWNNTTADILCDEYMRQQGFKSAVFVVTSTSTHEQTGYWHMDTDDYHIFNLLWAEETF